MRVSCLNRYYLFLKITWEAAYPSGPSLNKAHMLVKHTFTYCGCPDSICGELTFSF